MNFEDFGFSPFSQEVGAHLGVDASERRIWSKRIVRIGDFCCLRRSEASTPR